MSDVTPVTLSSGQFSPGSNTPTGTEFVTFVDNPYISVQYYLQSAEAKALGLNENSDVVTSGELVRIIKRQSAWINRYCQRWFDIQRVWETKTGFTVRPYNPQLITVRVDNGPPYNSINQCWIQVLQWFIPIITSGPNSYLQDFYDKGFYKIVPLLSSAGTGGGSPLPAAIVDRVPLGILWTDYTSGFGVNLTGYAMGTGDGTATSFQAAIGNQLWAPGNNLWGVSPNAMTPVNVYDNAVLVDPSLYTVDHMNGIITFNTAPLESHNISADFWTYETVYSEIKYACVLLTTAAFGTGAYNPLRHENLSVPGFSTSYDKEKLDAKVKEILEPFIAHRISIV